MQGWLFIKGCRLPDRLQCHVCGTAGDSVCAGLSGAQMAGRDGMEQTECSDQQDFDGSVLPGDGGPDAGDGVGTPPPQNASSHIGGESSVTSLRIS